MQCYGTLFKDKACSDFRLCVVSPAGHVFPDLSTEGSTTAAAMTCLYVWGSRYLGNCDYFEHEKLGELHVSAFSVHFCFLPLRIRRTELHLPNQRVVKVDENVRGASFRCMLWAWLRTGLLLLGLGMAGSGQWSMIPPVGSGNRIQHAPGPMPQDFEPALPVPPSTASLATLVLVFGGMFINVLAVVAFLYRPRASESARAAYCAKLNAIFIGPQSFAPESEMTSV